MRIDALIMGFIAALTIGTMAATSTLLPALEYVQEQADRKLNELRRFANTQVHGTPGRFINNDYMEGDCYPQNMDFKYADTPTAHTVQVRTEGESILVTDDLGRTHVLAGIGPIPKNEEYAQRATELLVRGDHPVTIYILEGKQRDGHTTAVLGLGEDQNSINAQLIMERVAWHPSHEGDDWCLTYFDSLRRYSQWVNDPWELGDISEYGSNIGKYPDHYPGVEYGSNYPGFEK